MDPEDALYAKLRERKRQSRKENIDDHPKFVEFCEGVQDQLNAGVCDSPRGGVSHTASLVAQMFGLVQ